MAGYVIYSLDWPKFRDLVERPSPAQLAVLAGYLAENLEGMDGEFDDDDPILEWPTTAEELGPVVTDRLARPDWYGDLSSAGKELWESSLFGACLHEQTLGVGFRVDSDGVYWDVINLICGRLGEKPETPGKAAMSRFGTVPFRYHPPARRRSSDWRPMHSMHAPDEVQRMLAELKSVATAVEAAPDADVRRQFTEELLPAVERVAADGRLLFVQVDT